MRKLLFSISSLVFAFNLILLSVGVVMADDDGEETHSFIERRAELRQEAEERREELQKQREEKRQELAEKREEFREHLAEIKDERKQKIVENLAEKLDSVNERWVEHWGKVLSRLTELLAKIESRTEKVAANGVDVSSVSQKIAAAYTAIDEAQAALDAQAANSYVITITDENRLGDDVQGVVSQLRADIKETHEVIKAAREAVRAAFTELKSLMKTDDMEDPENE